MSVARLARRRIFVYGHRISVTGMVTDSLDQEIDNSLVDNVDALAVTMVIDHGKSRSYWLSHLGLGED